MTPMYSPTDIAARRAAFQHYFGLSPAQAGVLVLLFNARGGWASAANTRAQADRMLDQAMAACGFPAWRRAVIWAAVRVGGARGWSNSEREATGGRAELAA